MVASHSAAARLSLGGWPSYTLGMAHPAPGHRPLTVEEYLELEASSPTKHEYVAGEVFAMSGVTRRHACIVTNIVVALRNVARGGPCDVLAVDVKLRAAKDRIYYPDVMVVWTPGPDDALVLADPCLVIEVTSPSTARADRGEKLDAYRGVASLGAYLVVDHRQRRVERHWRVANGRWQRAEIVGAGAVELPCPAMELTLAETYDGVELAGVREEEATAYEA